MKKYRDVEEYLMDVPVSFTRATAAIRKAVRDLSEGLHEKISYNTLFLYWYDRPLMYFNFSKNGAYLGFYRGAILASYFPELEGETKVTRKLNLPHDPDPEFTDTVRSLLATSIEIEISFKNGDPVTF